MAASESPAGPVRASRASPQTALPILIRPYAARDRASIQRICCDTAALGQPVERFFPDRDVVAALVTRYYTDEEPASSWVAECDGRVIGYLTGCLDTRRYRRSMARLMPRALLGAVARGLLCSAATWRLAWAGLRTWRRGGFRRVLPLERYPAHLHVNLADGFRGHGVGRRLLERFLAQAQEAGSRGVHAVVRTDNLPACRLFETMGFVAWSRHPIVIFDGMRFQATATVIYVKSL